MNGGHLGERAWTILEKLADGKFHSGEKLAKHFGISRACIYEDINRLADAGIEIQRIRGRGYRLPKSWDQLSESTIAQKLGSKRFKFNVEILRHTNSSNAVLMQRAALGAASGSVIAAELQTAGKGRLGRHWYSGLGDGLTFSVLWRFDCSLNELSGISLAVGVSIVRALKKVGAHRIKLKWPNDIQTEQGKMGGVLIESHGDMLGPATIVIGIGLNYVQPKRYISQIEQPVTSLSEVMDEIPSRNQLMAIILDELSGILENYCEQGFASVQTEWQENHAYQDKRIKLQLPNGEKIEGIAMGVNERGALRIRTKEGEKVFSSGEVGEAR